jgi:hypothetical protein
MAPEIGEKETWESIAPPPLTVGKTPARLRPGGRNVAEEVNCHEFSTFQGGEDPGGLPELGCTLSGREQTGAEADNAYCRE